MKTAPRTALEAMVLEVSKLQAVFESGRRAAPWFRDDQGPVHLGLTTQNGEGHA